MSAPQYRLRRNEVIVLCDSEQSLACADLVGRRDKNGSRESDFWGHPAFSNLPDGTPVFRLPMNVRNLAVLHECGAVAASDDTETMQRLAFFRKRKTAFLSDLPLRPFQRQGSEWLVERDLCAVLADDVGLGKSLISIAAMRNGGGAYFPAVIIAPAHIKLNWEKEWLKWGGRPEEIAVLFGRTPDRREIVGKNLIVLNHHILAAWVDDLCAIQPKLMLIDEAHNFVNSNTKTYPLAERLARACCNRVLELTATALVNQLADLWSLINLINPDVLGLKGTFNDTFAPEERLKAKMFASRWRGGFATVNWREVNKARLPKALMERRIAELRDVLHKTIILKRRKVDVVEQLPEITETELSIVIPETTKEGIEFWDIERKCEFDIAEGKEDILASDKLLAAFTKAKRNEAFAKIPDATEWLRDFLLESDVTEKIVVVGWSVEPLEKLHAVFKKESLLVNGSVDARKKHEAGRRFESDPAKRILFGNIKSVGTGIDLVAARNMFFFELPLTAVDFEQLKGRINRLSQTSNALSYWYMTIRGSLEEKLGWKRIRRKQQLADQMGL